MSHIPFSKSDVLLDGQKAIDISETKKPLHDIPNVPGYSKFLSLLTFLLYLKETSGRIYVFGIDLIHYPLIEAITTMFPNYTFIFSGQGFPEWATIGTNYFTSLGNVNLKTKDPYFDARSEITAIIIYSPDTLPSIEILKGEPYQQQMNYIFNLGNLFLQTSNFFISLDQVPGQGSYTIPEGEIIKAPFSSTNRLHIRVERIKGVPVKTRTITGEWLTKQIELSRARQVYYSYDVIGMKTINYKYFTHNYSWVYMAWSIKAYLEKTNTPLTDDLIQRLFAFYLTTSVLLKK